MVDLAQPEFAFPAWMMFAQGKKKKEKQVYALFPTEVDLIQGSVSPEAPVPPQSTRWSYYYTHTKKFSKKVRPVTNLIFFFLIFFLASELIN